MIAKQTDTSRRSGSRQQRRYDKTREKLLSAARSVFTEKGLAASIDEIAERADVARGSFYYHFKNKERLIRDLVAELLADLTKRMQTDCDGREGIESMLDGIIQTHINFFSDRWQDFVLYFQGRADLTLEESCNGLDKPFLKYAKSIEQLIDESVAEPISSKRLGRIATAIAGFVSGYYSFASIASTEADIDKEFKQLRTAFVTSLARFAREALPESRVGW